MSLGFGMGFRELLACGGPGAFESRYVFSEITDGPRFGGAGLTTLGQTGFGDATQEPLPGVGAAPVQRTAHQPTQKQLASPTERQQVHGHLGQGRRCSHGPADEIVSNQSGQPFLAHHIGGVALQEAEVHLGFDIAETQLNVPAQAIDLRHF